MVEHALVSVIVPLYNTEKHIAECINSVLLQTWPNIEVIVIDDGSTDNSFEEAGKFESKGVKLYRQQNQGASVARNTGLGMASGKYIQFLDADDFISPDKIEKQVIALINNQDCLAVCDTVYFPDGFDPYTYPPVTDWYTDGTDDPADFLIKLYGGPLIGRGYGGMIQPNAWLTPRHLIDKAGLWNPMRCPDDDGEFFCRVILAGKGVRYVPDVYNYYRKFANPNSLSSQTNFEAFNNMLTVTDLKARYLLSHNSSDKAKLAISRLYWENAFSFYPYFRKLSAEAELRARQICPHLKLQPYDRGIKLWLLKFIGWRAVKQLVVLKSKMR